MIYSSIHSIIVTGTNYNEFVKFVVFIPTNNSILKVCYPLSCVLLMFFKERRNVSCCFSSASCLSLCLSNDVHYAPVVSRSTRRFNPNRAFMSCTNKFFSVQLMKALLLIWKQCTTCGTCSIRPLAGYGHIV